MSVRGDPPDDDDAFRAELQALLRSAHRAGVDVKGGWECRNGEGEPDWDVVVTEIEKRADADAGPAATSESPANDE
ncbi:MAG: hypothetical protein ACOCPZ_00755 [Natrialbaceae archaeon]